MSKSADDYNSPWKTALVRYFPEFLAFYFPGADQAIDWSHHHTFLEQELAQIRADAELGRRRVDGLIQVKLMDGGEQWVYIHVEIQGRRKTDFAERLFIYNYRLYDRYRRPVATMAVLIDDDANWRPQEFSYSLLGSQMSLQFAAVKLLDYADRLEDLLAETNPFGLVTAAHLLTQNSKNQPERRYEHKWRLARLLYEKDWDKQRILDLFAIIDWLMQLPEDLERRLWTSIQQLERDKTMPYVLSVERIARQEGLEAGRQEGLQEGRQDGEATLILRQLSKRFGPLSAAVAGQIRELPAPQLEALGEALLDFQHLAECEDWLAKS